MFRRGGGYVLGPRFPRATALGDPGGRQRCNEADAPIRSEKVSFFDRSGLQQALTSVTDTPGDTTWPAVADPRRPDIAPADLRPEAAARKDNVMQAQPVQFKVGDKAVYPRGGVAEVIGIEELDIGGNRQRFYVLRLLQNNSKIRVPVGNANAVGLRQLISDQEIQEVFDILRERTVAFDKQTWNRRYRGFMDKIKTGSIYDVAEVLRDLYRLKTDKQLSFGEKRMLDEARSLIVKEIAIARGQTEDDVKNEIEAIFLSN
jgi:CarD family transcriptional regulator